MNEEELKNLKENLSISVENENGWITVEVYYKGQLVIRKTK